MKYIFYTNIPSPHQLPWCRELRKLVGEQNFLYIAEEGLDEERKLLGWNSSRAEWIRFRSEAPAALQEELETCDILITSLRRTGLLKKRAAAGLRSYYTSERWFKPPLGSWRMLHPGYFKMCREFRSFLTDPYIRFLPIGIFGVSDLQKLRCGAWNPFHRVSRVPSENPFPDSPMAKIGPDMRLWGYFADPGTEICRETQPDELSIFWCGRMLNWKRVDVLIKAVQILLKKGVPLKLTLTGFGPEEVRLRKIAGTQLGETIFFNPPAAIGAIRQYMQKNDVYVLSSDAGEGWGASLNEAMEEGMIPVGTYEAGSSATLLQHGKNGFLYHSKKIAELAEVLETVWKLKQSGKDQEIRRNSLHTVRKVWSPANAAALLLADCKEWLAEK